jgi:membrane protease subunit HflC
MNPRSLVVRAVLAFLALILVSGSTYLVSETEQVIITQFGQPRGNPVTQPGLHFKLPLVQQVNTFEKRFLEWDGSPNQMPTKDKRFIWVDMYARWRITDPLKFFQRLRDERGAQSRLDDILDGETRNAVASYNLIELVRSSNRPVADIPIESEEERIVLEQIARGRRAIAAGILEAARARTLDLGIEVLDIRLKRINYVDEVAKDVYARMIAERRRIAERFRSEGEGEAARIQGERQRDLLRIQSEAYKLAQDLRGKADAAATAIYAEAYGRDAEFYAFFKSLETYERVIDGKTYFILGTDSDLLKYLRSPK